MIKFVDAGWRRRRERRERYPRWDGIRGVGFGMDAAVEREGERRERREKGESSLGVVN